MSGTSRTVQSAANEWLVQLEGVMLSYADEVIVRDLSITLVQGRRYALMGQSGSGKTTVLRGIIATCCAAGILPYTPPAAPMVSGGYSVAPTLRLGYCPQDAGLADWLSVQRNIELGPLLAGDGASLAAIHTAAVALDLVPHLDKYPHEVSSGTAKRASLARCLVTEPNLLLLDEALSGLDFDLKLRASNLLRTYWRSRPHTTVLASTHDLNEAVELFESVFIISRDGTLSSLDREEAETNSKYRDRVEQALVQSFRSETSAC